MPVGCTSHHPARRRRTDAGCVRTAFPSDPVSASTPASYCMACRPTAFAVLVRSVLSCPVTRRCVDRTWTGRTNGGAADETTGPDRPPFTGTIHRTTLTGMRSASTVARQPPKAVRCRSSFLPRHRVVVPAAGPPDHRWHSGNRPRHQDPPDSVLTKPEPMPNSARRRPGRWPGHRGVRGRRAPQPRVGGLPHSGANKRTAICWRSSSGTASADRRRGVARGGRK
jgi:hypothetical protein